MAVPTYIVFPNKEFVNNSISFLTMSEFGILKRVRIFHQIHFTVYSQSKRTVDLVIREEIGKKVNACWDFTFISNDALFITIVDDKIVLFDY